MSRHNRHWSEGSAAAVLLPLLKNDGATMLRRVREQTASHPYRTMGVAALAGMVLSSSVGRALAGWAGVRVGWDVLIEALRELEPGQQGAS